MKYTAKNIIYIAMFTALIYVSSLIKIYIFSVPFTLQTMAVMLAACFLGAKKGVLTVSIYIAAGLIGLPVFTQGGGIMYVANHTFGYIVAFIPAAAITGFLKNKCKNIAQLFILLFSGGILMLLTGAAYAYILLGITSSVNAGELIYAYFLVFLPSELVKSVAAALLYIRLRKYSAV